MPNLIKPGSTKIITQDGEVQVSITLELNINLNSDGLVSAQATNIEHTAKEKEVKKEEKNEWMIPDFESLPTINFGKK